MNLDKLYKMQKELDSYIIKNRNIVMSEEELLENTILALLVEVGELANTTRCFKHWSTKGMMDKEIILEELADVLHFYLSIGNQEDMYINKGELSRNTTRELTRAFRSVFYWISKLDNDYRLNQFRTFDHYVNIGKWLQILWTSLGFTNKEVEQAYFKKHEENYRRQKEGY